MPINALKSNVVSRAVALANLIVTKVKPELDRLDVDYNGAVDLKNALTPVDLDSVPSFSGLTKAQLDDALYALTATIRSAVNDTFAALEQLAARA